MKKSIYLVFILLITASCGKDILGGMSSEKMDGAYALSSNGKPSGGQTIPDIKPGQITAGEWSDLKNWKFWNDLGQKTEYSKMPEYWSYNLDNRISVKLSGTSGKILPNVKILLLNKTDEVLWESVTDNEGSAELWGSLKRNKKENISDLKIKIENKVFTNIKSYKDGVNNLKIDLNPQAIEKKIDIAFMVDATGSMADELEYLKAELVDIINKVKQKNSSATINIGSVFYRDVGDEYVTRKSEFSTDISKTIDFIKNQRAEGGGDFPEAVHTALKKTLKELQWSTNSSSRVIFMILDAPPHYEPQIVSEINTLVAYASANGIKLVPIVASGINKETEFLMRYMSIATNGTYVFITNHSGIGNDHLEPTVGEYKVELLNELLVRLINSYI